MKRIALAALFLLSTFAVAIAGPVGGRKLAVDTVLPRDTDVYNVRCEAEKQTVAVAVADGDIDMKVYDQNGNLIASDTDLDGTPICTWTPRWTGNFRIEIINATSRSQDYVLGIE